MNQNSRWSSKIQFFLFQLQCPMFLNLRSDSLQRRKKGLLTFLRKSGRDKCQNDMLEVAISGVGVRPLRPDNGHNGCLESPGSPHTSGRHPGDIPRVHRCQETLHQRKLESSLTITTRTLGHYTLWDRNRRDGHMGSVRGCKSSMCPVP